MRKSNSGLCILRLPVLAAVLIVSVAFSACGNHSGGTGTNPPAVNESAGTVVFETSAYSVAQNVGSLPVSVYRAGGSHGAISVAYSSSDGTATAATDYANASGTLYWDDQDTAAKIFTLAISDKVPFTGSRSFGISLSNPGGGASLGTPKSATVIINGNAPSVPGTVSFNSATYTVPQVAGVLTIIVNRTGSVIGAASVDYAARDGSAIAGTDYTTASGTLSWGVGEWGARTIVVNIGTTPFAGARSFTIDLSNPTGSTIGTPGSTTITISGSQT